ncbi:unnamed protein product [Linum trigynum]|uniref:Uncharacterized protein n=1 Tax=Linum trigynum TaxID=586398 RepID=A0AAV2D8P9_9ROSI
MSLPSLRIWLIGSKLLKLIYGLLVCLLSHLPPPLLLNVAVVTAVAVVLLAGGLVVARPPIQAPTPHPRLLPSLLGTPSLFAVMMNLLAVVLVSIVNTVTSLGIAPKPVSALPSPETTAGQLHTTSSLVSSYFVSRLLAHGLRGHSSRDKQSWQLVTLL